MLPPQISRNPDLKQLFDEGFDLEIKHGHLVIKDVPYVASDKTIKRGLLIFPLCVDAADNTITPSSHTAFFAGDAPCDANGTVITAILHDSNGHQIGSDLFARHMFSAKPPSGYATHYEKATTYINLISSFAKQIDPNATAHTFPNVIPAPPDSVFNYMDTASPRAQITAITEKLMNHRIGIVGVGGTGSYILDFLAKTPLAEIHLFDGDEFKTHNAFRAPGAPSIDQLMAKPTKVAHLQAIYSNMHRHVIAHPQPVTAANIDELRSLDFVFICMDKGKGKRPIVEALESWGTPFIDVGMGLVKVDNALGGQLRTTLSTPANRDHFRKRVDIVTDIAADEYDSNIQIAELNAMNAAFAVVRWKKTLGFYADMGREFNSVFRVTGNSTLNEDLYAENN